MEKPPLGPDDTNPGTLEQEPKVDEDTQAFLEHVALELRVREKAKPVEMAMSELLGKPVKVIDFKHLDGSQYEFIVQVEDGEELHQIVRFPEGEE